MMPASEPRLPEAIERLLADLIHWLDNERLDPTVLRSLVEQDVKIGAYVFGVLADALEDDNVKPDAYERIEDFEKVLEALQVVFGPRFDFGVIDENARFAQLSLNRFRKAIVTLRREGDEVMADMEEGERDE